MKKGSLLVVSVLLWVSSVLSAEIPKELLSAASQDAEATYFIVLTTQADLSGSILHKTKADKGKYVYETLRTVAEQTQTDLKKYLDENHVTYKSFWIQNMILVTSNRAVLEAVAARQDVDRLVINRKHKILDAKEREHAYPSHSARGIEWGIQQIFANRVWAELGVTGEGIVVCDNDTGVQWDHPALRDQYRGWNGTDADHNYNWHDCTSTSASQPLDDHGHGTHTTGTMIGDDHAGNQIGVAPGARWIAVKNMDSTGGGEDAWFHESFQWILAPTDVSGQNADPSKAPHIVNNSWGFGGGDSQFYTDVQALKAAGIFIEVSAGNEGPDCQTLRSPGDYDNVLTTGATSRGGMIADFSSRGPSALYPAITKPDISAPGENIRSSVPGSGYEGGWSGTSMAGPHTCGMVALVWSANPDMIGQVDETIQLVRQTAVPDDVETCSGTRGRSLPNNVYGWGELNCFAATAYAFKPVSEGLLLINKTAFMCSDQLVVTVKDADLIGTTQVQVLVLSTTEPASENLTLSSVELNGIFTGAMTLATGTATSDGVLQISEGDTITIQYSDTDFGGAGGMIVTQTGTVDCSEPVISEVTVEYLGASQALIDWVTDEPATTGFYYAADGTPTEGEVRASRITAHSIYLTGLDECTNYRFLVFATDIAGNMSTDNNGGAYYPFETLKTFTVMNEILNTNPGWTTEGMWAWGQPAGNAGDPTSGFTGANVYGYNLDGAYENDMTIQALVTNPIDCSAGTNVMMSCALWLNVGAYPGDQAGWDVSTDGGVSWVPLFNNSYFGGIMLMDFWYPIQFNFNGMLDGQADVRFRWTMGPTNSTDVYGGWNIDDIKITFDADCDYVPPTPTPQPTATPTLTLGVRIDMPAMAHDNEPFYVTGYLDNPGSPLSNIPVFFLLEAFGDFWFWPSWAYYSPPESTDYDFDLRNIATGSEQVEVIPEFTWPDTGPQEVTGLHFYGAMLTEAGNAIMGEMALVTFGYGP